MDQLHLLWEYQKADVEVDKVEASIRRSPVRQKLVKYRDLYAEQQNAMKRIESEVATMQDRLEALKDAIRMTNEQVHALHAKMESEEPKSAAEVQQYMSDAKRFQNNLTAYEQEVKRIRKDAGDRERQQHDVRVRAAKAKSEFDKLKLVYDDEKRAKDGELEALKAAAAEKAKAAVLQAKANLVVAEYDLKKTTVFAPISGQIGKSSAHVGDYVAPSKGALAKIVQIDPIRVSFPLTDRAYIAWRQAQREGTDHAFRMRLILPDGSEYDREGVWDFDDNQMSRETASIMMRLKFPNPERLLIPNSYVTLLTDFQDPPKFPSVPQQALIDLPGGNQGVWVLRDDMTVEQRPVETKEAFAGWTPVVNGLEAGERVVISGVAKLGPGMKVAIVEPTSNDDINANHKSPIEE